MVSSKLVLTLYGLDGKRTDTFEVFDKSGWFADICNTLDHCRNTGLEPVEAVKAGKR